MDLFSIIAARQGMSSIPIATLSKEGLVKATSNIISDCKIPIGVGTDGSMYAYGKIGTSFAKENQNNLTIPTTLAVFNFGRDMLFNPLDQRITTLESLCEGISTILAEIISEQEELIGGSE